MTGKLGLRVTRVGCSKLGEWNELGIGVRTCIFWYHNLHREIMGNKAGDRVVAALNVKPRNLALVTRQKGRILSKRFVRREGQLNMVTDWTWKMKRI